MKRIFLTFATVMVIFISTGSALAIPAIGTTAPAFALTDLNGQTFALSQFRGKVVVLGLFHLCEPCRQEGAELQRIHDSFSMRGVQVIGINSSGDSIEAVKKFVETITLKVKYPYLLDTKRTTEKLYSVRMTPNTYIIDKDGIIRYIGTYLDFAQISQALETLLK